MKARLSFPPFVFSGLLLPILAHAQWPPNGAALTAAAYDQLRPAIVSDGAGGAIVAWADQRTNSFESYDVYVQRVSASGVVQWTVDGVALCTDPSAQYEPGIVSDGAGGAIVAWKDDRSGGGDVYAQRVNASGAVQWTANGIAICAHGAGQLLVKISSDDAGGAIVTWQDLRNDYGDIFAQRVNPSGEVQWTANGVALCSAADGQHNPQIASDDTGGAIVTWYDYRSGSADIYAQRVSSSGAVEWTTDGVALCTAAGAQTGTHVAPDGAGGALAAWGDLRNGSYTDIYAQRMNGSGVVQWTTDGVAICTLATDKDELGPRIVSDGAGGAIVTWYGYRSTATVSYNIYAQRVDASGAVQWTPDGLGLCTAVGSQGPARILSDGVGGAIVTWDDYRNGPTSDIYLQRVNASGVVQWTVDGIVLSGADNSQRYADIISDGAGNAILAWEDYRSGTYSDIYAQRLVVDGAPTDVGDAPAMSALTVRQNHPNPFAGHTQIEIELGETSDVRIEVFDVAGRRVRTIDVSDLPAGWRTIAFAGDDDAGRPLASGVYFYRVAANGQSIAKKLVIAR